MVASNARGRFRSTVASKMELFTTKVNRYKSLNIFAKSNNFDMWSA